MDPSLENQYDAHVKIFKKHLGFLERELNNPDAEPDDIEAMLQTARYSLHGVYTTQEVVLQWLLANDPDKYEDEIGEKMKYQLQMQRLEIKVSKWLNPAEPAAMSSGGSAHRPPELHRFVLPQKKLPSFGGDVKEWLGFWASYKTIHEDPQYTDEEKFQYLLQCITPGTPARKIIGYYNVSAKNYVSAVEALKHHFGRNKMLVKVYVRDLLQLAMNKALNKKGVDLMELVSELSSKIMNLKELGVTSDKCEMILYPVVESCLPNDILEAWQRHNDYEEKLDLIIKFLQEEVTNMMDRSLAQMDFGATPIQDLCSPSKDDKHGKSKKKVGTDTPAAAALMNAGGGADKKKGKKDCAFCGKSHESFMCGKAKLDMSLDEKIAVIKQKKLCFKCLRSNHQSDKCRSFVVCAICGGKHYEIICDGNKKESEQGPAHPKPAMMVSHQQQMQPQALSYGGYQQVYQQQPVEQSSAVWKSHQPTPPQQGPTTNCSNVTAGRKRVSLYTLLAEMETPVGRYIVRVFIDEGSEESYIVTDVANRAQLQKVGSQVLSHQVFGGKVSNPVSHPLYQIKLKSISGNSGGTFVFNGVSQIAQNINKPAPGPWMEELWKRGIIIHDQSNAPDDVQLLIGMDIATQIWTGGFVRIDPNLIAKETSLGWVIGGSHGVLQDSSPLTHSNMVTTMMVSSLSSEELWSLEALGIQDEPASQARKDLEDAAMQHFRDTVKRGQDGRYEVELPWINGHAKLSSNYSQAYGRLKAETRELQASGYLEQYHKILESWAENGIIEKVSQFSSTDIGFYMPHRHVIKESSSTTPLRPVFNASAKGKGAISLNDCLERGPNSLELIPGLALRLRKKKIGLISDIEKAFLQISVTEGHRDFLRFIWWKDTSCRETVIYRHTRVVFGVKSSPFLLASTLKYHIENEMKENPDFAKRLLQSLYVDNSVTSHSSMEEAHEFMKLSQEILIPAKFNLRGWEYGPNPNGKIVPVLGMNWNTTTDTLSLCMDSPLKKCQGPSTKRGLLAIVNSVFDPLGFVSPVTLIPKLLYQECCLNGLKWDEELPPKVKENLEKWKSQLPLLQQLQIPRWASTDCEEDTMSIHCFCDGSSYAFATCIYLRTENDGVVKVELLSSKVRVAPSKKKITIPRLELLACLIGARLTKNVVSALDFQNVKQYFWSDSTTALAWIKNNKEWGRFVSGRTDEIRQITNSDSWRHIPGEMNPADLPSRGCTVARLLELKWWEGPLWLKEKEEKWPNADVKPVLEDVLAELKKTVVSCQAVSGESWILHCLLKRSSYSKALRCVALINRYFDKLKEKAAKRKKKSITTSDSRRTNSTFVSTEEIMKAERYIVKLIQNSSFSGVQDPKLIKLGAFQDEYGIIRIKTQLLFGDDQYNIRCPMVLPKVVRKSTVGEMIRLIILEKHECNSHAGAQTLQAILRDQFWIIKGRRAISRVVLDCASCRIFNAKKCEVPRSYLPLDRIKNTVSFDVTGVDLAGPLFLRGGEKVWVVLYTDAVYRGVHLELTSTLSTEGFLRTLRRFVARRGRPSTIYSDNGCNFVGANNLFKKIDWEEVEKYAHVERINWRFNPPTAAWWGGFWESMVRLMKKLLRPNLGKKVVGYDELHTILCDVEATMNSRPLTFMSDAHGELQPLCPMNFMRDNPSTGLPEVDAVDAKLMKSNLKILQHIREELRLRFRKEYLAQLRHQATLKEVTVKKGDVVLMEFDDKKRLEWPLGVVQEVYPGRDGKIRTALVKTKTGVFPRAVQRLYILETREDDLPKTSSGESNEEKVLKTKSGRVINKPDRLQM